MKKLFTLIAFATILSSTGIAQTCNALLNLQSTLDTPVVYYAADTGKNPGYVSGNNLFNDQAVAEGFAAIPGDSVYYANFYFGIVNIAPEDSDNSIEFAVWDNAGTSFYNIAGAPGNIIDTATVTLRQIAQAVTATIANNTLQPVQVNFAGRPVITTDTIYIGVLLPAPPSNDTIALFTNTVPPGPDGNGWDYQVGTWGSYTDDFGFQPGLGNYISAEICGPGALGIKTIGDNIEFNVFPNPANDQLNFQWNVNDEAEVVIYDVTGKSLKSFSIQGTALNTFNIHDLAQGTYIIRVTDRQTNQQRSSLFIKL